ncbi:ABC transporter permease [Microbacterium sp. 22179]|jgi:putative ABC transport system permease protein|uniref:ABC transporter permease n=1 Tax=Microbacterium sp. 22179 TaxID=3453886 RepID=UPI003F86C08D
MYIALRDLRFARGRFVLIGTVVALITVLVGFLSGLTGGLAVQNISAVVGIAGDRVVFADPGADDGPSFAESRVTAEQASEWESTAGVESVHPLGISQTRAESEDTVASIAVFGVQPGFAPQSPVASGELVLSRPAADELDAHLGDPVTIAGTAYTVVGIEGDDWYSHTPVVRMTLADWQAYAAATGDPDAFATVLAVTGSPDWDAADSRIGTRSTTIVGSLTALSAFRSEIGSLLLMVAMLFGISALVIGAFFTVWTMQRTPDIAILKALGARTSVLVRDALGQAALVLVVGIGVGIGVVSILGALAGAALPFLLSPLTTVLPAVLMIVLGLAGAAFALRSVTSADPLTSLGSNR